MGPRVSVARPGMRVDILTLTDGFYELVSPVLIPYESHGRNQMRPLDIKSCTVFLFYLPLWPTCNLLYPLM